MKRVVIALALALMLVAFGWDQVLAADINDPGTIGDDHPWGSEDPSDDPGQFRHSCDGPYLTGNVIVNVVLNSTGFIDELEALFSKRVNKTDKMETERDGYIDRSRQLSLD